MPCLASQPCGRREGVSVLRPQFLFAIYASCRTPRPGLGELLDGRSPDSRVEALLRLPTPRGSGLLQQCSPLTVAGAVTDLAPFGYTTPYSLFISPECPRRKPSRLCTDPSPVLSMGIEGSLFGFGSKRSSRDLVSGPCKIRLLVLLAYIQFAANVCYHRFTCATPDLLRIANCSMRIQHPCQVPRAAVGSKPPFTATASCERLTFNLDHASGAAYKWAA